MNSNLKKSYLQIRKKIVFVYIIKSICLAVFLSNSASAAVWLFDPTVALSYTYDDNYRLSADSSDEDEVSTTKLAGRLALKGKSERLNVRAILGLDTIKYSGDDSELSDRDNQIIRLTSAYRVTERNKFSLNGKYIRDSVLRTSRISLLEGGGEIPFDPDQDVDENLVQENVRRTRSTISPGWNFQLDEKTLLGLKYAYQDRSYSGDSSDSLTEFERQTIKATISRQISEKDKVTGSISETYYRPDEIGPDRDVDTIEARLGWVHRFTESFEMDFTVGGRDSDFDNAQKSSDSGFVGNIGATKRTSLTNYRINLERRESPSSSGSTVEVDEINVEINHAITEKLTFGFDGRYFDTESTDNSNSNSNREYMSLEPGLFWRFLPSWVAGAGYRYTNEDLDTGGSGDSNAAYIRISWSPPRQF